MISDIVKANPAFKLNHTSSRLDDLASVLEDVKDKLVEMSEEEAQRRKKKVFRELVENVKLA